MDRKKRILTVSNKKGGVGKTTTAMQIAQGLADRGKKGLLLDFDPQCNFSNMLIPMRARAGTDTYIPPPHPDHPEGGYYSIADLFKDRDWNVYRTGKSENLFVLPAASDNESLNQAKDQSALLSSFVGWMNTDAVWEMFDFVLIDTAPATGTLTQAAIAAATDVLIPCVMEKKPFEGLMSAFQYIEEYGGIGSGEPINIIGVLPTKFDARIGTHNRYLQRCKNSPVISKFIMDTLIKERPIYKELDSEGVDHPYRLRPLKKNQDAIDELNALVDYTYKKLWE